MKRITTVEGEDLEWNAKMVSSRIIGTLYRFSFILLD